MEKLKKIFVMVGVPGSGKSTWIQNHKNAFAKSHNIISRDEIRFSLVKENEEYFSKENEVFREFIKQIKNSLENYDETYVDATHLNESSRAKLLRNLGNILNKVEVNAIVIKTSLENTIKQNNLREGRSFVPVSVIRRMNSQMTIPSLDEGFDHIYIYENVNGKVKYRIIEKGVG